MSTVNPVHKNLTSELMLKGLRCLDEKLAKTNSAWRITLIIGGGGAMLLAYAFPLATADIDAMATGIELAELDRFTKEVAGELNFASDWLNPYFSTYAHTLPSDYGSRLTQVFHGKTIEALALGPEDLLIMKCFAHRQKDVAHARALLKNTIDVKFVEDHLQRLKEKRIPGVDQALEFLWDLIDNE